jgi:hypothetical protein
MAAQPLKEYCVCACAGKSAEIMRKNTPANAKNILALSLGKN